MFKLLTSVLIVYVLTISQLAFSQNNTTSPYSKLGLGEFENPEFGRNSGMGYTGIALRSSDNVNPFNPASYSFIDSTMVLYEIGLHFDYDIMDTYIESGRIFNANLSHINLGFAINSKWAMTFGISPYTSVGYKIETEHYISESNSKYTTISKGTGGLTSLYGGLSYRVNNLTSIGLNATLIFGPKKETQTFEIEETEEFEYKPKIEKIDSYLGGKFDIGLLRVVEISKKQNLIIGLVVNPPGILKNKYTYRAYTSHYIFNITDTIEFKSKIKHYITIPPTISFGLAYEYKNRFVLTGDFKYNQWSKMKITDDYSELVDNYIYSFGVEYRPKFGNRFDLCMRGGVNYETGYYVLDNFTLKNYAVTAGLGLRIKAVKFDLFGSFGRRGTFERFMVRETNYRFGLNITYIDYWFQKRKFK